MAKPDDRSDNASKLQEMKQNTIENLEESESYLEEFAGELNENEAEALRNKNERRREAIPGFESEIEDESEASE